MVDTAQCAYLPFGGTGLLVIQIFLIILYTSDDSFKIHSCAQEKGQQRMWSAPGPFTQADMSDVARISWLKKIQRTFMQS